MIALEWKYFNILCSLSSHTFLMQNWLITLLEVQQPKVGRPPLAEDSCRPLTGPEAEDSCRPLTGPEAEDSCRPLTGPEALDSCRPLIGPEAEDRHKRKRKLNV